MPAGVRVVRSHERHGNRRGSQQDQSSTFSHHDILHKNKTNNRTPNESGVTTFLIERYLVVLRIDRDRQKTFALDDTNEQ